MGVRTVRLDDRAEGTPAEVRTRRGLSISEAFRRNLRACAASTRDKTTGSPYAAFRPARPRSGRLRGGPSHADESRRHGRGRQEARAVPVDAGSPVATFDPSDGARGRRVEILSTIGNPAVTTVPVLTGAFRLLQSASIVAQRPMDFIADGDLRTLPRSSHADLRLQVGSARGRHPPSPRWAAHTPPLRRRERTALARAAFMTP